MSTIRHIVRELANNVSRAPYMVVRETMCDQTGRVLKTELVGQHATKTLATLDADKRNEMEGEK